MSETLADWGMPSFHRVMAGLYDLAGQAESQVFEKEALRRLAAWIGFDGVVLWIGKLAPEGGGGELFSELHMDRHGNVSPSELLTLDSSGSAAPTFREALGEPVQWQDDDTRQQAGADLAPFAGRHGMRRLMLFGEASGPDRAARWLMPYRLRNIPFDAAQVDALHASWFHLWRALEINRSRILDEHDPGRLQRASALSDMRGFILAADPNFHRELRLEWPEYQSGILPPDVHASLAQGRGAHRGRRIEVAMTHQSGYVACSVFRIERQGGLSPREYMVARRYAGGLSHKKIARELGISPHTVRNQIAQLYGKLGIHNKAALALYLSGNFTQGQQTG